jgi:hypothetical protein
VGTAQGRIDAGDTPGQHLVWVGEDSLAVENRNPYGRPSASSGNGPSATWKCRWGASELPLLPTSPRTWPGLTWSPTSTGQAARLQMAVGGEVAPADVDHHVVPGTVSKVRSGGRLPTGVLSGIPSLTRTTTPAATDSTSAP